MDARVLTLSRMRLNKYGWAEKLGLCDRKVVALSEIDQRVWYSRGAQPIVLA